MNPFWNAATTTVSGPLTEEHVRDMLAAMRKQLDEPPRRCSHVCPAGYVRRLRERGDTTATCLSCGQTVRL